MQPHSPACSQYCEYSFSALLITCSTFTYSRRGSAVPPGQVNGGFSLQPARKLKAAIMKNPGTTGFAAIDYCGSPNGGRSSYEKSRLTRKALFMDKMTRTWSLMSESWQMLKRDKKLLLFPLISGICSLLLLASFAYPLYKADALQPPDHNVAIQQQIPYYATLFVFYVCNYFIVVFFNAAIIACAAIHMRGGKPTIADGFRVALSRLPAIAGWALILATVGLVMRIIQGRSGKIGRLIAGFIFGIAWTLVSFLVVPILVMENKNPIAALKESSTLLQKTWGEQVRGNIGFGLIFLLLASPAILLIVLCSLAGNPSITFVCIGFAMVYMIVLAQLQSALLAIFQAALYLYARDGQAPQGFSAEVLGNALS
jgi:Family of unknown function (DUF6159)